MRDNMNSNSNGTQRWGAKIGEGRTVRAGTLQTSIFGTCWSDHLAFQRVNLGFQRIELLALAAQEVPRESGFLRGALRGEHIGIAALVFGR